MSHSISIFAAAVFAFATLVPAPGRAQMAAGHDGMGHDGMGHGGSQGELGAAMERMNRDMMAPQAMAGDADHNFVAMMIPHHQGAIDMARLYLRDGRDKQIRRLAQTIIVDQEREIREMRAWQAKHPSPAR